MNFNYSETQRMVADAAKEFAEKYIRPHVMEWDESQEFPVEVFRKAGELGFMGVLVPEAYGGSGLDYHDYIAIVEEISKVDPSIGLSIAAHNSLCTNHILSPISGFFITINQATIILCLNNKYTVRR